MYYNCSLVWHSNRKIHIIDNVKAPTVSSCFKFNGAETVNSLFFTGVFPLAATAQSKRVPSPMLSLQAYNTASWWQRVTGNRFVCTSLSCLNYLVEPLVCVMSHFLPVRLLLMKHDHKKREFWGQTRDMPFPSCMFWTSHSISLSCSVFSKTWKLKPTNCSVTSTGHGMCLLHISLLSSLCTPDRTSSISQVLH